MALLVQIRCRFHAHFTWDCYQWHLVVLSKLKYFWWRNSNISFLVRSHLYSYVIYRGVCRTSFIWEGHKHFQRKKILPLLSNFLPLGYNRQEKRGGGRKKRVYLKRRFVCSLLCPHECFLLRAYTYYFEFHHGHMPLMSHFWTRLWWYIPYN